MSVSRTPNSSPPSRPATSEVRRSARRRAATAISMLVAGRVAEAVVDGLEVVEVEEQGRDRAGPDRGRERRLGGLDEPAAVGQPGQRVVERLVAQLRLERAALGHVTGEHADQTGEAGQDQQRQDRGARGDDREAAVGARAERDQERAGDHRRGETDQPDGPEPRDGDRMRLGQAAHRRVGGGRAEEQVRDEVERVDRAAADVGPVEVLDGVDLVRDEQQAEAQRRACGTTACGRRASSGDPSRRR